MAKIAKPIKFSRKQLLIIVAGLSLMGILLVLLINAATAAPRIYLNPSQKTVDADTDFSVDVLVDTQGQPVSYVKATYSYPSSQLDLVSIDYTGSQFPLDLQSSGGNGTIVISRGPNLGTAPVNGNGLLLAKLNFHSKVGAGGTTANITFDSTSAMMINNDTTTNIITTSDGSFTQSQVTINSTGPPPIDKVAVLSLDPSTQTVKPGDQFNVSVHVNSQSEPINAVGVKLLYPDAKVDFVSADISQSAFKLAPIAASASGGIVSLEQSINAGGSPVSGDQLVATLTFKAKADASATDTMAFAVGTVVYRASDSQDIYKEGVGATIGFNTDPGPGPETSKARIYISPATQSVDANATFTMSVRVDSQDQAINSVGIRLSYPADKVDFISADTSSSLFSLVPLKSASGGTVSIDQSILPTSQPVTGDQLLATLTFSAKSNAAGIGTFAFADGTVVYRASDSANTLKEVVGANVGFKGIKNVVSPTVKRSPSSSQYATPKPKTSTPPPTSIASENNTNSSTTEFSNVAGTGATVQLIVLDSTKHPLINTKVTLNKVSSLTDSEGKVTFTNVPAGTYQIKIAGKSSLNPGKITVASVSDQAGVQSFTIVAGDGLSLPLMMLIVLVCFAGIGAVILVLRRNNGPKPPSSAPTAVKPSAPSAPSEKKSSPSSSNSSSVNVNTKVFYPNSKK